MGSLSLLQGNLPNPGIEARSPAFKADSLPAEPQREAQLYCGIIDKVVRYLNVHCDGFI